MKQGKPAEQWDLLFMFPNLAISGRTPFRSACYAICAGDDAMLDHLVPSAGNATSLRILQRFQTSRGEAYRPACFLVDSKSPTIALTAEALRAFRNICAIATITGYSATRLAHPYGAQWAVAWADHFQFSAFVSGRNGAVQTIGMTRGMDTAIPQQQPASAVGDPTNFSIVVDHNLLDALTNAWERCYLSERHRRRLLRLFRALDVAFHAALYPDDGLRNLTDAGNRLASWVSAFEVLCHPDKEKVSKQVVQGVLGAAPYRSKDLIKKRYTVSYEKKKRSATLPEALYDDLYAARNSFIHGNPVTAKILHYRESRAYAPLSLIAPVLFSAALVSVLKALKIRGGPVEPATFTPKNLVRYMKSREGMKRVEDALVAAGQRRE